MNLRFTLLTLAFITCLSLSSQTFIRNTKNRPLTFKEVQLQFDAYRKSVNLKTKKHWKSFKRWEYDMSLHTNAQGEPDGFADYVNAAVDMANYKQQQQQNNASASWSPTGPNVLPSNLTGYMENGIGRVNCVAFHPTQPNTIFAGVAQGGLWKTTNNGVSWTPLTDNLPVTRISDISIDPNFPNIMYISVCDFEYIGFSLFLNGRKRHTHYGVGVYKSTDGGNTWSATGLTFQLTQGDASLIRRIIVNPANSNHLVACGVSGMYKSTNGGATWVKKLDSLFWDMHLDPANPSVLYASTGWVMSSNTGNAGVYKSTDFGNTWTMLNTGMPLTGSIQRVKLAIAPSDPNYIYAATVDLNNGLYGVYTSTNAGVTWSYIPPVDNVLEAGQGTGPGGQGNYDLGFMVDPANKFKVYIGGVNLWGSADGCNTFSPISHWTTSYGATLHGDIHFITYQNTTGQYYVTSDGGIYRTGNMVLSNWGTSAWPTVWTKLNNGLQVTSFYRLSSSRNAADRLVAGAQDNATFYYKGGTWYTIFGGDGMDNYLDPVNNSNVIGSSQYGSFYGSNNDGSSSFYPTTNPLGETAEWLTPIAADYSNPGVLYIGNENVVQSTDNGNSWTPLATIYTNTTTSANTEISALAVSPTNSLVVYAARRVRYEYGMPGMVFKTTNGGASFTNCTGNLPDSLYYTDMAVDENNANTVYISMAGFSANNKVYKTTNGGTTWTNISYNLPNLPVNAVKQIPGTNNLIVATDIGVYVLTGGTTNWTNMSFGLPNVIVSDIEFNVSMNKAYVSTFGRGIWETSYSLLTSVSEKEKHLASFNLYPSLNKGAFTVSTEEPNEAHTLEVINVMGQQVYKQTFSDEKLSVSLDLPAGMYYARVSSKTKSGVKQFVVE